MNAAPRTPDLERHLERHPASPLFARFAERLLKSGEVTRALSLCESGLKRFPSYTTGHLIHARCLAARGDHENAIRTIDRVLDAYPGNIMLGELRGGWTGQTIAEEEQPGYDDLAVSGGAEEAFVLPHPPAGAEIPGQGGAELEEAGPPKIEQETEPPAAADNVEPETVTIVGSGDVVESAADGDSEERGGAVEVEAPETTVATAPAGVPDRSRTFTGFIVENRIVSRTLAEIYANQGAILEAVKTYRLLVEGVPEKREMYEERLRELEERLRLEPGMGDVLSE